MENSVKNPTVNQVFNLIKYTFVVVPIVAGLDKFSNILTQWDQYLNPTFADILPLSPTAFMKVVGVIEIVAGVIVLKKTELGGYIVATWLTLIALTLVVGFNYVDVAVRDLVMAIAAYSLARLSKIIG